MSASSTTAQLDVIAFSLYGRSPKYAVGALRNVALAARFYPAWTLRFYVGASVPEATARGLADAGAEVVPTAGREDASAMFWRFLAFEDPRARRVMVRDCDSRFSERERAAVTEWLARGDAFHILRDHPLHDAAMLGGLWGAHTAPLRHLGALVRGARVEGRYGEDQRFLRDAVYPLARGRACVHDSFFAREPWRRPFPTAREGAAFVGEVFDEDDRPRLSDRALLTRAERSRPGLLTLRARSWLRARLGR